MSIFLPLFPPHPAPSPLGEKDEIPLYPSAKMRVGQAFTKGEISKFLPLSKEGGDGFLL